VDSICVGSLISQKLYTPEGYLCSFCKTVCIGKAVCKIFMRTGEMPSISAYMEREKNCINDFHTVGALGSGVVGSVSHSCHVHFLLRVQHPA
jgi:hypothetical protein